MLCPNFFFLGHLTRLPCFAVNSNFFFRAHWPCRALKKKFSRALNDYIIMNSLYLPSRHDSRHNVGVVMGSATIDWSNFSWLLSRRRLSRSSQHHVAVWIVRKDVVKDGSIDVYAYVSSAVSTEVQTRLYLVRHPRRCGFCHPLS